jgi:acylphosphatase
MVEPKARRFVVHGRVQGVNFRYFVSTCADALGVRGWVTNRDDGTVEVHAEGSDEQLGEIQFDLSRGSRYARVEKVDARDVPVEGFGGFEIRR